MPSSYAALQVHISYLTELAQRLQGTDREAVLAAAGLLREFGEYLQRTGVIR